MKLAAKLILIFLIGVFGIVSLFAWQTIRRQDEWEKQRRESHAGDLAETLAPAIEKAYKEGGSVTIKQAVEVFTQRLSNADVRWIDGMEVPSEQTKTTTRKTSSISITDATGDRKAYSYVPVTLSDGESGAVEVSEPMDQQDAFAREAVFTSLLSLLGVAAFSAIVIYYGGVQLVGKPLGKLIDQVKQIGEGQLNQPPALQCNDELGRLALAISEMSYRLSQQRDTIRHSDRLSTIGTLAAGMAHELGTPLNVVSGRAGLIASGKLTDEEIESSAKTIKSEADRMAAIIRQLLDFARQKPSPHEMIRLNEVVERTCELTRPLAEKANVDLSLNLPEQSIQIDADAAQIQQVLTNLITNAIAAMPSGGTATVSLSETPEMDRVTLRVTDTGTGIDSSALPHLFEPFYTTKDVGEGTGLGLSIAYSIVREHGGDIQIESELKQGTTFKVTCPKQS